MPFSYGSNYVQSVVVKGTLYVGGGGLGGSNGYIVMVYNISAGSWATLPPYQASNYAMTAIDSHLVLVGGKHGATFSKVLGVWSADSKEWTHPYPDMTTPRAWCSAVSYKHWVVVAGGRGDGGYLSSVEVMNIDTKQWHAGPPTPIEWTEMKAAVVGDMCYYMGGCTDRYTTKVYSVSLPALISTLTVLQRTHKLWKELPQLPVQKSAPLSISGSLVAVGGVDKDHKYVSTLHLYQPDARQWVEVADMPTTRISCTCSMITDNKFLIAGGTDVVRVDIAQI